ncbi:MAG: DUF2393 family protein [Campylobacterales bacterium]|nr:DUF2393 family protein [Campylobacterales bacterium]
MSPLTPWHYFLIGGLGIVFVLGVILAYRSDSRVSVIATITLIVTLLGMFMWSLIDENVYRVEISNVSQQRYYQSEQLLIKGVVRNVGKYPVANVVAVVKLSNAQSGNQAKASQFARPGAFAELFEGDNPEFKRNKIVEEHVIADYLNPGMSKTFRIMMDYPPHFQRVSYDIEAKVD